MHSYGVYGHDKQIAERRVGNRLSCRPGEEKGSGLIVLYVCVHQGLFVILLKLSYAKR